MNPHRKRIRVGTRGSLLARTQTNLVVQQIQALYPELDFVVQTIQTTGDARQNVPFAAVGTKGMFVKEIEQALLDGEIDLGVHSLKDMPSDLPQGLALVCIPLREDPLDALLCRDSATLLTLPHGATVGTSSLRRQTQIRALRPDLQLQELRGNLDTRLRKLDTGEYDAIMLACAGLNRLGLGARITERLAPDICCPAVGQGALALEARADNDDLRALLLPLHHANTAEAVRAERAFLRRLEGGCSIPAGAFAEISDDQLMIRGVLASEDGRTLWTDNKIGKNSQSEELGTALAESLLAQSKQ